MFSYIKGIALSGLTIGVMHAAAASTDVTTCENGNEFIETIYDSASGVLRVEIKSPSGNRTFNGQKYITETSAQIKNDPMTSSFAQKMGIRISAIDHAAVSWISQTSTGYFVLFKFVGIDGATLGTGGVDYPNPFICGSGK